MKAIVLLFAFATLASATDSLEGFQVWRLEVETKHHSAIRQLVDRHQLDVWGQGQDWMDVMVSPTMKAALVEELATIGVRSTVNIEDLQPLIERDFKLMAEREQTSESFNFEEYHDFEEIEAYLVELSAKDNRTNLVSLGKSPEGREMWQLAISVGGDKPAVWVDCGIHAREWISPAVCMWGINHLLTGYGTDKNVTALLDAVDIFILPSNNPDGYAFSRNLDPPENRIWRKNREVIPLEMCVGIDLNRNFDYHFGGPGTSTYFCSAIYKGPYPASEKETKAVQGGIKALAPTAKALFSLHSYGQMWMFAFGYTDEPPAEFDELDRVSNIGVAALTSIFGTQYTHGPISTTIYPASGTTVDYGYSVGIVHSYTIELRDTGTYGFFLPAKQIADTAYETWTGMIAAILAIP